MQSELDLSNAMMVTLMIQTAALNAVSSAQLIVKHAAFTADASNAIWDSHSILKIIAAVQSVAMG